MVSKLRLMGQKEVVRAYFNILSEDLPKVTVTITTISLLGSEVVCHMTSSVGKYFLRHIRSVRGAFHAKKSHGFTSCICHCAHLQRIFVYSAPV